MSDDELLKDIGSERPTIDIIVKDKIYVISSEKRRKCSICRCLLENHWWITGFFSNGGNGYLIKMKMRLCSKCVHAI